MSNFMDVTSYPPNKHKIYLIDTNVLIYLFYVPGNYDKNIVKKYGKFYSEIIKNNSKILLPLNLITEFANKIFRIEYSNYLDNKRLKSKNFNYKLYRKTEDFNRVSKMILNIIKLEILPYAEKFDYKFVQKNLDIYFNKANNLDLNDSIYYDIAKEENIPIITHDKDFKNITDVTVITANYNILKS